MGRKLLFCIIIAILILNISDAQEPPLDVKVSWLGNTFGGEGDNSIQNFIDAMIVLPDGTVITNSGWDEDGGEASLYRDGRKLGDLKDLHGWGRGGGDAVAADDEYIYVTLWQSGCDGGDDSLNANGLNSYPPCYEDAPNPVWFSVRRYDRATLTPVAFPAGYGGDGSQLIVSIVDSDDDSSDDMSYVSGLAVKGDELFVADPYSNLIKVYSTQTLDMLREFPVDRAGEIAIDSAGDIWILRGSSPHFGPASPDADIVRYSPTGEIRPQRITFDAQANPTALAFDNDGRLLVTDNGSRQQVLIYADLGSEPVQVATFGAEGGVFSGVPGQIAPLKFYDVRGVGVDADGNIYVGMGSSASGTHLQSYAPDGQLRWDVQGLFFVDTVGIDPDSDGEVVYGKHERFALDYTVSTAGGEASYLGYTLNPFKYPDDIRNSAGPTDVFVQRIEGQTFMYMTDMYASYIAVYRFDTETDGEIAIPSGLFIKEASDWFNQGEAQTQMTGAVIWRDADGDGSFDPDEFDVQPDPQDNIYTWGWWIDSTGTVWRANREDDLRQFPVQGLDDHGNPIYTFASSTLEANPAPFDEQNESRGDINRIAYLPETDTLYLTGYTGDYPNPNNEWGVMGRVIVRYDAWSSGDRQPDWTFAPPIEGDSLPVGWDIAGDYLFLGYTYPQPSHVKVYTLAGEYVGQFSPDAGVGEFSGWFDTRYPLRAIQRANGEIVVFAEEDARGKNIIYRWMTP